MDKFLNFYSKYPWVALVLIMQWAATAFTVIYADNVNVTNIMGIAFFTTIIFAYFGFKVPKG
ncbi:MAG: hypothetical protein HZC02_05480 [Candidatus Levybacteria bacterium]|nr:hypothetical protein [Candidatus Levybacteria bacterium]